MSTVLKPRPKKMIAPAATPQSPEHVAELIRELAKKVTNAISNIGVVNAKARYLSLNAQIEAGREHVSRDAFGIVANAMSEYAKNTAEIADKLSGDTNKSLYHLEETVRQLATNVRGTRLADLALMNIDLIDRNLYERSCDVRWWATDASLVDALASKTQSGYDYASHRMGIILNSYTVYFDLVLADLNGTIVANGRPAQYSSVGQKHDQAEWFQAAVSQASGEEFGFESTHVSSLVDQQRALVYSCGVRQGGNARGRLLGVLGIVFNWDALAQTIVTNTRLPEEEKKRSRVLIADKTGLILADSRNQQLVENIPAGWKKDFLQCDKNFAITEVNGKEACVAHARSVGFETYATGWHSFIIQHLK